MLYNSQADQRISGVTVRNITITGTHPQGTTTYGWLPTPAKFRSAWSSAASHLGRERLPVQADWGVKLGRIGRSGGRMKAQECPITSVGERKPHIRREYVPP